MSQDTTIVDGSQITASPGNADIITPDTIYTELGLANPTPNQVAVIANAISRVAGAIRNYLHYDPVMAQRTEIYPNANHADIYAGGTWEANQVQAYFRRFATQGMSTFALRHIPLRSVQHLFIDYDARAGTNPTIAFPPDSEFTEGGEWWPNYDRLDSAGNKYCTDGILRHMGAWPTEPGSIKVIYTAGYNAAELAGTDSVIDASSITLACITEACRQARRTFMLQSRGGAFTGILQSENLGGYSYSANVLKEPIYGTATLSAEACELLSPFVNLYYDIAP